MVLNLGLQKKRKILLKLQPSGKKKGSVAETIGKKIH